MAIGEGLPEKVRPLWPWVHLGDLVSMLLGTQQFPQHPGERAAQAVARQWLLRRGRPTVGVGRWHLLSWATTVWVTRHWTAAELTLALGQRARFGRGATEIAQAARTWFGRELAALAPHQIALLVSNSAMVSLSSDPLCHPDKALARRNQLLARLQEAGVLNPGDFEREASSPLDALPGDARACERSRKVTISPGFSRVRRGPIVRWKGRR